MRPPYHPSLLLASSVRLIQAGVLTASTVLLVSLGAPRPLAAQTGGAAAEAATPRPPLVRGGAVEGEGSAAMGADQARADFGVDGMGVTIGVLSDSYGDATQDLATGDVPAVQVLLDVPATDEGRAMVQLAYDVAPGASFLFHTAAGGEAALADAILALAAAGADIIVDDAYYPTEPFFQDGLAAQAVDLVVAQGIPFFSAAGNFADQTYEADYVDSDSVLFFQDAWMDPVCGAGGGIKVELSILHDFGAGDEDFFCEVTLDPDETLTLAFQWAEPYASAQGGGEPSAQTDLDLYLVDAANRQANFVAGSCDFNVRGRADWWPEPTGDPVEVLTYQNTSGAAESLYLAIASIDFWGQNNPPPPFMKWIDLNADPAQAVEFGPECAPPDDDQEKSTVFGHPNAVGAFAVGASGYFATPSFEPLLPEAIVDAYSSWGGLLVHFDGNGLSSPHLRHKPDLIAPAQDNNTFFDEDVDSDGLPNFRGTSAAAANLAGVAALMLHANPNLTPAELYSILRATAHDLTNAGAHNLGAGPGYDTRSGYGFVDAYAAVAAAASPLPVSLAAFDAVADGSAARLMWTSLAETDDARYEVQHLAPGPSGAAWTTRARVPGRGSAHAPTVYHHLVDSLLPGLHRFRLRQVDAGGGAAYSPEATVRIALQGTHRLTPPYPNPFNPETSLALTVETPQHVEVAVYDALGRRVALLHDGILEEGRPHRLTFDGGTLPSGLYLVRARGERFVAAERVLLVR